MEHIDEQLLETDLAYRFEYLKNFIGFDETDVTAIRNSIAQFAPCINKLVDATYERLLSYDATARHFVPRQHGYEGDVPESLEHLTAEDNQIKFRKDHLQRYFMKLLGHSYDAKMVLYLDMVGKIHTPKAGSQQLDIPLVQMNALMGLISDQLIETFLELDIPNDQKFATIRAFQKLLWIQNDFISRHYVVTPQD
ncbi:MAG: protoglobin family protein [Planctomycetes bacterium]|nr:protoglobin family protein [Planctomycetota bacterium]MCH9774910.1 protoglobin family protein [Planctomycetota bacterium]MCH9791788.1 protoglobin family protein [Planctomycetota bacterium]MDF1745725.1 protoglobin family protein [Gimesia sp.]